MQNHRKYRRRPAGFALIITLSLMILLVVIAVGLLSLSSVSLRASGQASAGAIARENARLGMIMALGELQKGLGSDTSASGDSTLVYGKSVARPHLLGAWQRPSGTGSRDRWHWTPSPTGTYSGKAGDFKGWMVSTASVDDQIDLNLPGRALDAGTDVVSLVGSEEDELRSDDNISTTVNGYKVRIGPNGKYGKYAWAVFDESVKAPINLGDPSTTPEVGEEIASRFAPPRVRADVLQDALENALRSPKNLISMDTVKIPGGGDTDTEIRRRFHDFTTDSFGLLTDSARGGLRYDLTTLLESSNMPTGSLPEDARFGPYPPSFSANFGAPSWTYFQDMYQKYRSVASNSVYRVGNKDLQIFNTGTQTSPQNQRLLPVLAKLQIAFSIVSHNEHISGRIPLYNANGGNDNFGVIHLVYDPIITLYNPYDVALDMSRLRIRIWDPPVGFRFTKIPLGASSSAFRVSPPTSLDAVNGGFYGLARHQIQFERNANARKAITMILTDGTNNASGGSLRLLPGEVKVFAPRVDDVWNWAYETKDQFNPYAFFDWRAESNFGNIDNRSRNGLGAYGIESVPGWTPRAGMSTDHLAFQAREAGTKYDFEKTAVGQDLGAYVPIRLTDSVRVDVKPMITSASATKNFQVDILAGLGAASLDWDALTNDKDNSSVAADRLRTYSFTLADVRNELVVNNQASVSRTYTAGDLLQSRNDKSPGGKKTIAMLEMSARTTYDSTTDSKPWLFNNPVVEGADQASAVVGLANQSYDLRFYPMNGDFYNFPNGVDIDPDTFRGFFGASSARAKGSSFVPMIHVPVTPMASLGELVHTNPISSSALPRVTHPFGNSRSHPLVDTGRVSSEVASGTGTGASMLQLYDHSYVLNDSLWDRFYFSSIADYGSSPLQGARSRETLLEDLIAGTAHPLNGRLGPVTGSGDPKALAEEINGLGTDGLVRGLAAHIGINGPFNLNSTSVDAWRAVLSSLRDRSINGSAISGTNLNARTYNNNEETPLVRMGRPLNAAIDGGSSSDNMRWAGFRALSDEQITDLAKSIVAEILERGDDDKAPAFSIAEFVNRRLGGSSGTHVLTGLLQTAIDKSGINDDFINQDGKAVTFASVVAARRKGVMNPDAMNGTSTEGAPLVITQGDLMAALAPIVTVRGDTFKIRSYGESTDSSGKVTARAWCEAVVQRVPEFVDPIDAPDANVGGGGAGTSSVNETFGRRFNVVSFRWLNEKEI